MNVCEVYIHMYIMDDSIHWNPVIDNRFTLPWIMDECEIISLPILMCQVCMYVFGADGSNTCHS